MEIKVAIIEDTPECFIDLKKQLIMYAKEKKHSFLIEQYKTGEEFLYDFHCQYDLIFFDIELAGQLNGIQTAEKMRELDEKTTIIFTTRLAQFATHGYAVNAKGYLLKPIQYYDLNMVLKRVFTKYINQEEKHISISVNGELRMFSLDEIYYLESEGHNISYHTNVGTLTTRGKALSKIALELEQLGFAQCNASYIVNLKYCNRIVGDDVIIEKDVVHISRSKKKEFMNALTRYYSTKGVR